MKLRHLLHCCWLLMVIMVVVVIMVILVVVTVVVMFMVIMIRKDGVNTNEERFKIRKEIKAIEIDPGVLWKAPHVLTVLVLR